MKLLTRIAASRQREKLIRIFSICENTYVRTRRQTVKALVANAKTISI